MTADSLPDAITLRRDRLLLRWPDGPKELSAGVLRAACRCAECRAGTSHDVAGQPSEVALTGATPIGQYALQLTFSDRHARGIYPWSLLRSLGLNLT